MTAARRIVGSRLGSTQIAGDAKTLQHIDLQAGEGEAPPVSLFGDPGIGTNVWQAFGDVAVAQSVQRFAAWAQPVELAIEGHTLRSRRARPRPSSLPPFERGWGPRSWTRLAGEAAPKMADRSCCGGPDLRNVLNRRFRIPDFFPRTAQDFAMTEIFPMGALDEIIPARPLPDTPTTETHVAALRGPYAALLEPTERHGYALYYGNAPTPLVRVAPDDHWPGMWRMIWPDGRLSDMANLARAKDAAAEICDRGPPRRDRRRFHWKIDQIFSPSGLPS
jgi:hypothetical protein